MHGYMDAYNFSTYSQNVNIHMDVACIIIILAQTKDKYTGTK